MYPQIIHFNRFFHEKNINFGLSLFLETQGISRGISRHGALALPGAGGLS